MDKDIFAEVKRIEEEAAQILAHAGADREKTLKGASEQAERYREESQKKLELEKRLLREEHESRLAKEKDRLEGEFEGRMKRLEDVADKQTDKLADWVVGRFLEESQ